MSLATSRTITGLTNGVEHQFRVRARSSIAGEWATVTATPMGGPPFPGPAPLAYWRLGDLAESAGSGSGYPLTNFTTGATDVAFVPGKIGNAAEFTKTSFYGNYLKTPTTLPPWSGTTKASISVWVNRFATAEAIIVGDPWRTPLSIRSASNGQISAFLSGGTVISTPQIFPNNVWGHIVATWDSGAGYFRLYQDGVLVWNKDWGLSYNPQNNEDGTFIGGNAGATEFFTGLLDEVGIWDVALSDADVAWLYNNGNGADPTA